MAKHLGAREVAVAFTGWLNVHIPSGGREAQRNLIRPLGADTFVAGTFLPGDCKKQVSAPGGCLINRFHGLQPITSIELTPMLSHEQLKRHAESAPAFDAVSRGFRVEQTFDGVVMFAPVLGNPNVSVMRELHDCHRALALIARHEAAREWRYTRVVFSRLEFRWVAPHPPLSALNPSIVWVPSGQNIKGINDRHAVMPRAAADAYFGRWELLLSSRLLQVVSREGLQHMGPEEFLLSALEEKGFRVGKFPALAMLDCCDEKVGRRCFSNQCQGIW